MRQRVKGLLAAACAALLFVLACEGPVGPEGPPGPTGPAGPGTPITFNGTIDANGEALVNLPAQAGTASDPPVVACYVSDQPQGPFLVVSFDSWYDPGQAEYYFEGCALGTGTSGTLAVAFFGMPPGWYYWVVVVF